MICTCCAVFSQWSVTLQVRSIWYEPMPSAHNQVGSESAYSKGRFWFKHRSQLSMNSGEPPVPSGVMSASQFSSSSTVTSSGRETNSGASSSYNGMYCSAKAMLSQSSMATHCRNQTPMQPPLINVAVTWMSRSPSALSKTPPSLIMNVGSFTMSNVASWHAIGSKVTLGFTQTGASLSTKMTSCSSTATLPQASVAVYVRLNTEPPGKSRQLVCSAALSTHTTSTTPSQSNEQSSFTENWAWAPPRIWPICSDPTVNASPPP